MNRRSIRLLGWLSAVALVASPAIPPRGVAQAADNTFVLNNAGFNGAPGGAVSGNYDQTFAGVEISATPDPATGMYKLEANEGRIPLSWEYYPGNTATGTGSFLMRGTYDPTANAVTGTFTMEQEATGSITTSFAGDQPLGFALIWRGDVTGSVENNVAQLFFSGTDTIKCSIGADDCGTTGTQGQAVWFDVSNANYTIVPGTSPEPESIAVLVSGATGDVYFSPADQAGLETSARTWQAIKPGQRLMLQEGLMLRTGRNSSLKIMFDTGARFRLQPSTLFGVKKLSVAQTPMSVAMGRLYDGIVDFYMGKWKDSNKKFEVETDMANTSIKGTTYQVAVTDATTVVTVAEGIVEVTDTATGTAIDVGANERATVDATGITKAAAPDAAAVLDENTEPGASAAAGASPSAESAAATSAPVAAVSSADAASASPAPATPAGTDSGGSSLPLVLGVVAAVVIVAVVAGLFVARRRATPADTAGPSDSAGPSGAA